MVHEMLHRNERGEKTHEAWEALGTRDDRGLQLCSTDDLVLYFALWVTVAFIDFRGNLSYHSRVSIITGSFCSFVLGLLTSPMQCLPPRLPRDETVESYEMKRMGEKMRLKRKERDPHWGKQPERERRKYKSNVTRR